MECLASECALRRSTNSSKSRRFFLIGVLLLGLALWCFFEAQRSFSYLDRDDSEEVLVDGRTLLEADDFQTVAAQDGDEAKGDGKNGNKKSGDKSNRGKKHDDGSCRYFSSAYYRHYYNNVGRPFHCRTAVLVVTVVFASLGGTLLLLGLICLYVRFVKK